MRSSFIVGVALGALAGMMVMENNRAKQMVQKGKQLVKEKMNAMQTSEENN